MSLALTLGADLSVVLEILLEKCAAVLPQAAAQVLLLDKATDQLASKVNSARAAHLPPILPLAGGKIEAAKISR